MHGNIDNIKGNRYGNLIVLELTELKLANKRGAVWKCQCDCGNICYKTAGDLKDKRRKTCSCGCMSRSKRKFPNKFVEKESLTRVEKARIEFVDLLLERLKEAPYIDELTSESQILLDELNGEEKNNN